MKFKIISTLVKLTLKSLSILNATVIHNLAKFNTLKMVFHTLALENFKGSYVEFGVASGNSLQGAILANNTQFKSLNIKKIRRNFYGFDTFEKFQSSDRDDKHQTWEGGSFSFPYDKVKNRFTKYREVKLIKTNCSYLNDEEKGLKLDQIIEGDIAIALFDMDLKEPTYEALNWIKPKLKTGSILIFDELFGFLGDEDKGEAGALKKFQEENKNIKFREFKKYGCGGVAFQINIEKNKNTN
jgi:hypothetical protein